MSATQSTAVSASTVEPTDAKTADSQAAPILNPQGRDLDGLAHALTGWLAARMPGAADIRLDNLSYPVGAGMSHETILFDASWTEAGVPRQRGMVVRIKPTSRQVFLDDMFVQQYQLMELMHRVGAVPVATPLWFESDASLLGSPFFVMEKVFGRVAITYPPYSKQGWLFDSTPAQRRVLWEDSVRMLARIQTVPVSEASFLTLPAGSDPDPEVDRYTRYLDWVDPDHELTLLRQGFARLLAARPANRPEGIVWGDARLGNIMVGDDYKTVAVMDWEQPSLGGALHDLGWWLCIEELQTVQQGIPVMEGMGSREETIALWEDVSGKSAADIEWYEGFASFKLDAIGAHMVKSKGLPAHLSPTPPGERTRDFLNQHPGIFPAA